MAKAFIGIGAQKSGTSWLGKYLNSHPEVYIGPIKELHFFDRYKDTQQEYKIHLRHFSDTLSDLAFTLNIANLKKDKNRFNKIGSIYHILKMSLDENLYSQYFTSKLEPRHKLYGEITPSYATLDRRGFQKMKELAPNPKIIFIMRNPIDRYWSQLRFTAQKMNIDPIKEFKNKISKDGFRLRNEYHRTIEEVESIFGKEDIFYTFYEDIFFTKKESEIQRLCKFLDISYIKPNLQSVVLPSQSIDLPQELREFARDEMRYIYDALKTKFGSSIPNSWKKDWE